MKQKVADSSAEQEAMLASVESEVEQAATAAKAKSAGAKSKSDSKLLGIADQFQLWMNSDRADGNAEMTELLRDIDTQTKAVQEELKGAFAAEATKVHDVVSVKLPEIDKLTKESSLYAAQVWKYKDKVQ